MDMADYTHIGRYGTISLMKRQELNTAVTAFGIDSAELTFGRDPNCGVRLYYTDVSLVHCKIVFEDNKAFLVVLGTDGLIVDGCKVSPNTTASPSPSPTTIPLTNNSEFEIHGKRFRFTYPPKELRPTLYASPARPANRALRLSLIASTQVFSPRPSPDPRENLRILKSPLKNTFKTPMKSGLSTPLRTTLFSRYGFTSPAKTQPADPIAENVEDDPEEVDSIILVDGNHPRVVEDEKDLVILEDIEVSPPAASVPNSPYFYVPQPQAYVPAPQTPVRRRSLSRNTLHRAVLIRSAQRAVLKAESDEKEREQEEMEEMEVLDAVASDADSDSDEEPVEEATEDHKDDVAPLARSGEEDGSSDEDDNADTEEKAKQKLSWRKSLEQLWPFRSSSPTSREDEDNQNDDVDNADDGSGDEATAESETDEQDENHDIPAPLPQQTPIRRHLGLFMTPQVHPRTKVADNGHSVAAPVAEPSQSLGASRFSLGGGEARRVIRTDQVWKVRDIVVPESSVAASRSVQSKPAKFFSGPGTPGKAVDGMLSPIRPTPRKVVNEEERKAIQERRRSALRDTGTFFPGGVPGMGSPIKPLPWSSATPSSASISPSSSNLASSSSRASPSKPSQQVKEEADEEATEALDTRSLLEKMKETVEGIKKRRSLAPPTPIREEGHITPGKSDRMSFGRAHPASPSKTAVVPMLDVTEEEFGDEKENDQRGDALGLGVEQPAFSLLRSNVPPEEEAREWEEIAEAFVAPVELDEVVPMDVGEDTSFPEADQPVPEQEQETNEAPVEPAPVRKGGRVRQQKPTSPAEGEEAINRPVKSKLKTPARRTKTKSADPAPVDEDAAPPPVPIVPKSATRRGRKVAEPEESDDGPVPPLPAPAPAPLKRGRKATSTEPEDAAIVPTHARRSRKATAEPEDSFPEEKHAPVKRGRKPQPAEDASIVEQQPAAVEDTVPKRSGRKAAVTATAAAASDEAEEPIVRRGRTPKATTIGKPGGKATTRGESRSGSAPKGTKAQPIDLEDGADPLDFIDTDVPVAVAKAAGRKKIVKEEVVDQDISAANAPPVKSRAKSSALKTPTAAKARATAKRTPATAPAAVLQGINKENTPGSETSGGTSVEEPVKVRVSRTSKKAASGAAAKSVKREESDGEAAAVPEVPRGRVMRATRARTRT